MLNKQAFRRKEILEAGVDPSEFLEFMAAAARNKGSDLEQWKMSELRKVVKEFKLPREERGGNNEVYSNYPKSPSISKNRKRQLMSPSTSTKAKRTKKNTWPQSIPPTPFSNSQPGSSRPRRRQRLHRPHPMQDHPTQQIKNTNIEIKVTKYEKIEGGAFERAYVIYTIEIPALKSSVSRRYSDFVWLREVFSTGPWLPLLAAAKKGNFARYDDKYLSKKRIML
jgi:sorting nexin-7/30/sorting nexin-8